MIPAIFGADELLLPEQTITQTQIEAHTKMEIAKRVELIDKLEKAEELVGQQKFVIDFLKGRLSGCTS